MAKSTSKPPSDLKIEVAARLRAVQAELNQTQEGMAELVGTSRSAWSNWVNANMADMPAEEAMIALCRATRNWNLTLDWIYRGVTDQVNTRAAIRLTARALKLDPDTAGAAVLEQADHR
jgi:transcriptional regulator with XRE-family HTH domain